MALPLAKLTIVVGAGIVGSIIVKEGRLSDVPNFLSGAFKIVRKHIQEDKNNSSASTNKEYLVTQVNNLRKQLETLKDSGPVTIITNKRGYGTYKISAFIIVGAAGYVFFWWKGWKISDMMFVTRRAFSDACENVSKQLDSVSSAVRSTKKHLSNRIDRADCTLNDCLEVTTTTRKEISDLNGELSGFHGEFESVHRAVQTLESKIVQIEGSQDFTTQGVYHLCQFVKNLDNQKQGHRQVLQTNSTGPPALEQSEVMPIVRTGSLPPLTAASEPASPSTSGDTPRVLQSSKTATASSFKEVQGLSTINRAYSLKRNSTETESSQLSNKTPLVGDSTERSSSRSSRFNWRLGFDILTRARSSSDST